MKTKQKLWLKKELYFLKYIITHPFAILGESIIGLKNLDNWLRAEAILIFALLFRNAIIGIIMEFDFSITFDRYIIYGLIILFLTFIFNVYKGQTFEKAYREEEMSKLKYLVGGNEDE